MCDPESSTPLRVCVDARLVGGMSGGVEQAIIGLASGLAQLTDGNEEYLFLTFCDHDEWLRPFLRGPCQVLASKERAENWKARLSAALPLVRNVYRRMRDWTEPQRLPMPISDGTIESNRVDVMHLAFQQGFLTSVPSIYHPWDLQHLHLPELFTRRQILIRERYYRGFCSAAHTIAVSSDWVKRDVVDSYDVDPTKIAVIPQGATLAAYAAPSDADLRLTRNKFGLADAFAYFPAQTWPHKNHLKLLEALAILRDRENVIVPLVCSGRQNDFHAVILRRVQELGLAGQIQFLGFITSREVYCLYKLCRCVVFPSKFEGFGLPLFEALFAGVPLACSNATCLPETAGTAARFFNPDNPDMIAAAINDLWRSEALREVLVQRGHERVKEFSWETTARTFRAHYRRIARRALDQTERELIARSLFADGHEPAEQKFAAGGR
jgi:glycosyltransferase involved in cell wall biosynthesis